MEPAAPNLPDVSALSNDQLDEQLSHLCSHLYAAEYRLLQAIREWDSRELCDHYGVRSTAHWLNHRCGIALGAAREKVRVARALAGLPQVSAHFARGQISYSKVRAITRVATPENESYLLGIALHGTASHMERMVSAYCRVEKLADPERILRQRRARGLDWYFDDDGMLVVHGRLPPEEGALLIRAIEAMGDRIYREKAPQEPAPDRLEGDVTAPTICARRADALVRLVESGARGEPRALGGAERVQVVLHVPVTSEAPGKAHEERPEPFPALPRLDPGTTVSWHMARRLACEASRVVMIETGKGEPLSVGRRSRSVPGRIRQALEQRDGGCRFPGCTESRYVDAHHIHHWADGGETSLENLVLLCRRHHRLVHEEGFACERTAEGEIRFRYPGGGTVPEAFPLKRGCYEDLVALHERAGLELTAETSRGGWLGEPFSLDEAVALLFQATYGPAYDFPPPPRACENPPA